MLSCKEPLHFIPFVYVNFNAEVLNYIFIALATKTYVVTENSIYLRNVPTPTMPRVVEC